MSVLGVRVKLWPPARAASALDRRAISLAPRFFLFTYLHWYWKHNLDLWKYKFRLSCWFRSCPLQPTFEVSNDCCRFLPCSPSVMFWMPSSSGVMHTNVVWLMSFWGTTVIAFIVWPSFSMVAFPLPLTSVTSDTNSVSFCLFWISVRVLGCFLIFCF